MSADDPFVSATHAHALGSELTVEISQLLDVPVEGGRAAGASRYRVRVHAGDGGEELCRTEEIEGPPPDAAARRTKETVSVPPQVGTLTVQTSSPRLFFLVERCGADGNDELIGEMKLLLRDQRTRKVWRYQLSVRSALSDREIHAGCGIELKVTESQGATQGQAPPQQQPKAEVAGEPPPRSAHQQQAAINADVQDRAFVQQCKIASRAFAESGARSHTQVVNGYREWQSLDTLFTTMGPNPLSMTEKVGPTVARAYQESVSVLDEVAASAGGQAERGAADKQLLSGLVRGVYGVDPQRAEQAVRPVVCKDPADFGAGGDAAWYPDPPMYVPLQSISAHDMETMRLACYDPAQCAKVDFVDANPTYRVEEDVWGLVSEQRRAAEAAAPNYIPKITGDSGRVKDECFIT
mmetsp:Transcript_16905/g.48082  ORF Transcript_16905/g.48082 Transcript_16905/m.48082 type:complete len:409 (+) Transcript_16905:46-1272(+)|eukprot:CAMPEP_0179298168 /NCGR_PEP_ID=MMETSP0797-20121207/45852_1 /TAXON_ID=47934 /ORGANISM="Dinophysis acuminata, Strain DAEP01" /LENGTH=408 /DNA_ID=CAMNT_0021007543 /DNA_START=46 /DNA_END=1272 /DNA_ORIENTATION=+